jgi:hypothetical protein
MLGGKAANRILKCPLCCGKNAGLDTARNSLLPLTSLYAQPQRFFSLHNGGREYLPMQLVLDGSKKEDLVCRSQMSKQHHQRVIKISVAKVSSEVGKSSIGQ